MDAYRWAPDKLLHARDLDTLVLDKVAAGSLVDRDNVRG
jgi:hypothetical protein